MNAKIACEEELVMFGTGSKKDRKSGAYLFLPDGEAKVQTEPEHQEKRVENDRHRMVG